MSGEIESLESLVKKPTKIKKPANGALWVAYLFFNVVILVFDAIAAVTVYKLTDNYGYGFVTFMAGFVPLLMHEALYLRAYASQTQRYIAVGGAILSALTVAIVALLAAAVNFANASGLTVVSGVSEMVILLIVVGAALIHALLAAIYFYADEGIRANHTATENMAFHEQRMANLNRAEQVLSKAATMREQRARIVNTFGGVDGKAALTEILRQLGDDDGDGIPNFMDRKDNRKQQQPPALVQTSADTEAVKMNGNGQTANPPSGQGRH